MPYKRRKLYKKRKGGRKLATIAKVKRLINSNAEHKYFDFEFNAQTVDFSGAAYSISDVTQGDGDTMRDGDKLLPTSLSVRYAFQAGDATNAFRFLIIRWKCSASTLSIGNIFQTLGTTRAPYEPLIHDQRNQFDVLMDRLINLDTYHPQVIINKRLKLAKKMINYSAAGTTGSNKLFVVVVSDSGAAAHPTLNGWTRLNFTDS